MTKVSSPEQAEQVIRYLCNKYEWTREEFDYITSKGLISGEKYTYELGYLIPEVYVDDV